MRRHPFVFLALLVLVLGGCGLGSTHAVPPFDHRNPDGAGPGERLRVHDVDWITVGENIAMGFSSPDEVMDAWMESPGHCSNILDVWFTHIGIGVHTSYDGGPWWTQDFFR